MSYWFIENKKSLQKQKGANYDISIDRSFVSCDAIYFTIVYIFLLSIVWTTTHPFIEYLLIVAVLILYVYIWLMVLYRYRRHAWLSFRKQLFMVVPFYHAL